jgi:iron complex transport system ATP-binding protein
LSILEIRSLNIRVNDKDLISNFSICIKKPSFVAILGHNGIGKSTFLKVLNKQFDYLGNILLYQSDLQSISNSKLSQIVSFLQQKNPVFFDITTIELIVMGRFRHKKFLDSYSSSDYDLAIQVMHQLGIENLADKNFSNLSGGEQQLVWIAQMLLQDTEIWMLDEPTQQLDLYNKKIVFALLKKLALEKQKTILCITHDINCLKDFTDQFYINLSSKEPALKRISQVALLEETKVLESLPLK